jgi:hypothetical protein
VEKAAKEKQEEQERIAAEKAAEEKRLQQERIAAERPAKEKVLEEEQILAERKRLDEEKKSCCCSFNCINLPFSTNYCKYCCIISPFFVIAG